MPNNLRLKFTPEAQTDLFEIFDYIEKSLFAPTAAVNLIEKIEQACRRLTDYPFSCPIPRDDMLAKKGYRMLLVDNFIAFYMVDENHVTVMRVMYGRETIKICCNAGCSGLIPSI